MKCPYCGHEMRKGVIQSARKMFFTTKEHKVWLVPDYSCKDEVLLSHSNWTSPTIDAMQCEQCKRIIIDYSEEIA